jgi:hypothetical protein
MKKQEGRVVFEETKKEKEKRVWVVRVLAEIKSSLALLVKIKDLLSFY